MQAAIRTNVSQNAETHCTKKLSTSAQKKRFENLTLGRKSEQEKDTRATALGLKQRTKAWTHHLTISRNRKIENPPRLQEATGTLADGLHLSPTKNKAETLTTLQELQFTDKKLLFYHCREHDLELNPKSPIDVIYVIIITAYDTRQETYQRREQITANLATLA